MLDVYLDLCPQMDVTFIDGNAPVLTMQFAGHSQTITDARALLRVLEQITPAVRLHISTSVHERARELHEIASDEGMNATLMPAREMHELLVRARAGALPVPRASMTT